MKFEKAGSHNVRSERGRKTVSIERIRLVTLHVEEDKSFNIHAITSVYRVAEAVDIRQPTILNIMRSPMAESFVAACDMLLKFHNLSAKFECKFNE